MEPKSAATGDTQSQATPSDRGPRLLAVLALLLAIAGTCRPGPLAVAEGAFAMVVTAPHDGEARGPTPEGLWAERWFSAASLLAGQIGLSEWALRLPYAVVFFALGIGLLSLVRRGSEVFLALASLAPLFMAISGRWIEPRLILLAPAVALASLGTRPSTRNSPYGWGLLLAAGGTLWLSGMGALAAALLSLSIGLVAFALRGRAARTRAKVAAGLTALALAVASRLPSPLSDLSTEPLDGAQGSPLLFAAGILALLMAAHPAWRSLRSLRSAALLPPPVGVLPELEPHKARPGASGLAAGDLLVPLIATLAAACFLAVSPLAFALPLAALPLFAARAVAPERWPQPAKRELILGGIALLVLCLGSLLPAEGADRDDPLSRLAATKAFGSAQALVLEGVDRFRLLYYIHRGHGTFAPSRLIPEDWSQGEIATRFASETEGRDFANRQKILVLLPAPAEPPRGLRPLTPPPVAGGPQAFELEAP